MWWASRGGHVDLVRYLLEHGANAEVECLPMRAGYNGCRASPYPVCWRRKPSGALLPIDGENAFKGRPYTPLMLATLLAPDRRVACAPGFGCKVRRAPDAIPDSVPYLEVVKLLLLHGARPDAHDCAALDIARFVGFDSAAKLLEGHTLVKPVLHARRRAEEAAMRAAAEAEEAERVAAIEAAEAEAQRMREEVAAERALRHADMQAWAEGCAIHDGEDPEEVAARGPVDNGGWWPPCDERGHTICNTCSARFPLNQLWSGDCRQCAMADVRNDELRKRQFLFDRARNQGELPADAERPTMCDWSWTQCLEEREWLS